MTDYDPRIAACLDRLNPPLSDEGSNWEELVREAGAMPGRQLRWSLRFPLTSGRRRIAVLAGAVVATVLVALPALAVTNGWWFLGPGAPKPTSDVTVVTSGRSTGIGWTMAAYVSEDKGVCVAFTPDVGKGDMGGGGCGAGVRGEPNRAAIGVREERHWIGWDYFALGLFDFPEFVFGPVAEGVENVDLVLSNGQTIRTATIDGPKELNAPVDFYVVELPRGVSVESIVARDGSGTILERRRCRLCSAPER